MESLNTRLKEINEGKEEFYRTLNKQKIDELFKGFGNSKFVEDILFKTVSKMESLKNTHEESAYIFLKLKEMLNQQDKISVEISENEDILKQLKKNIHENVTMMKNNIEAIKSRLNKIKK
jgi:hypothetical protein